MVQELEREVAVLVPSPRGKTNLIALDEISSNQLAPDGRAVESCVDETLVALTVRFALVKCNLCLLRQVRLLERASCRPVVKCLKGQHVRLIVLLDKVKKKLQRVDVEPVIIIVEKSHVLARGVLKASVSGSPNSSVHFSLNEVNLRIAGVILFAYGDGRILRAVIDKQQLIVSKIL